MFFRKPKYKPTASDFQPHLVTFTDGSFGVRRWSIMGGWEYAGHLPGHWWRQNISQAHNYVMTAEQARANWAWRSAQLGEGQRVETTTDRSTIDD